MKDARKTVERVQTGVRIEKRLLQILKAVAAREDIGLGDLLEGIVLHSFEGRSAFGEDTLVFIAQMRSAYGLDLTSADSHRLSED